MLMAYLTLISGLLISAVAIFYSVAGLTAIFSAAVWPIIIMGVSLEVAKLVATVWVKQNWTIAPRLLKGYLLIAITILMVITSLGIFGYLSKAHSDQSLVSGDVQSKIAIYDEKIKTAKDNIDANRKALKQMDEAVDQVMGRSSDEKGADKAVALRRSQQKERQRLQSEIASEQKIVATISEERAPVAAEVRKVESEVGPIKYIAAFIYGDNPDANILEKAVTWVIILIVIVFDPLAIMLLLASQYSFALLRPKEDTEEDVEEWFRKGKERARQLDEEAARQPADLPVDSDPPIPAFLLKKNQPDFDAINLELAEAAVVPEPIEPEPEEAVVEYKILEDADDDEFIVEVPYVHETGTDNPIDFPKTTEVRIEYIPEDEPVIEESNVTITHITDGMIIGFADGSTQEIPVINNPQAMDERPGDYVEQQEEQTYVQNEEQKESDAWTKIVNKTITEEEYLKAVQQNKKV
jgi:hypothetical protein